MIQGLPEIELFEKGHRACAGCGCALAIRYALKAAGPDTIVCQNTGCMEVISTPYPETAWKVPWIHVAFENAAAVASGVEAALKKLKKSTNVLAIAGDGGTFDIGFQALSGAIERGHHFCYVCYDNNAYMNCLSTSSMIMTESGLKKITEVKEDDKIYAFDQKTYHLVLKKCIGVFDNGIKDVYELSTFHHSIKATSNHPFLVLKRNGRGKSNNFIWKKLEDVKVGDEVVVLKGLNELSKSKKFDIQKVKKGDYKVNRLNEYFETEKIVNIKLIGKEPTLDLRVEGEHNFIADGIVVHNTGIQRSGATPKYADTTTTPAGKVIHGKLQPKKPMPLIIAAHGAYVATANIAYPADFYNKIKKGLAYNGPSYIQVFAPCVVGWKYPPNMSIEVCKLAFQTKITPLYEISDGILTFSNKPSQAKLVAEFLKMQGWYKHLTDSEIQEIQKYVDEEFEKLLKLEETKVKI